MKLENFSNWTKWHSRNNLEGINYPGIYTLAITSNNIENNPFSIINDIVYFGMTNSINGLRGRLNQFNTTIKTKKRGIHGGAERFLNDDKCYENIISGLYVSVNYIACKVDSYQAEDLYKMGEVAKLEYVCIGAYAEEFNKMPKYNDKRSPKNFSELK